jgi:hypothetical protein
MSINPNWDYSHVRGYRTPAPTPERRSGGANNLRTLLNQVAHQRATEVARKKRLVAKLGAAVPAEFRRGGVRT